MKILIVEDDLKVGRFIEKGLKECAYTVTWARTCEDARNALCETAFNAVILDLGLPDGDGLSLLREWRQSKFDEPVIILSARGSVQDRIEGLNIGADDYLAKPFSFEELIARVRSLFRRNESSKTTVFEHRNIKLDLLAHTITINDKNLSLTVREFALLELFMQNIDRVLTRTQIGERIWDAHYDMQTNLIDVYVRKLRKKFREQDGDLFIETVRGVGYKMI